MDSHIIFQLAASLALALAAILQLAVYKAPDVAMDDIDPKRSARRLMILCLFCAFVYLSWASLAGHRAESPMVLILGLMGVSQAVSALTRLFPGGFHGHA